VEHEDPVELTIALPAGGTFDGPALRGYLEAELADRAEVTGADAGSVTVRAYHRQEVEAVAHELIYKLTKMQRCEGSTVRWTGDDGAEVVRPV
jgi:hypothetical protein